MNAKIKITPPDLSEIAVAIKQLPNNKAAGIDGIPAELFKANVMLSAEILLPLITSVWDNVTYPQERKKGIIVKLAKKGDLKDCNNWRGICVLPVVAKIITRIILDRLKIHLEASISSCQAGFRSGFSCADHINTLRIVIEQCTEYNSKLHLLFIDFEKAFDSVNRECIWAALRRRGVPVKLVALIKESYRDACCHVLHKGKLSEPFHVLTGVRQGCILSPILFLLVIEDVLNASFANENHQKGIQWQINNAHLNYLAYADDICLLSHRICDLKLMTQSMQEQLQTTGLKINVEKTKAFHLNCSSLESLGVGAQVFEGVDNFCYLGCMIAADGGSETDVENRITKARAAFGTLAPLWQNNNITTHTKLRIFNACVKSVLLYGCTTWKVTAMITRRLQTFINRCLRRIMRIFWPRTISNTELRRKTNQSDVATEIRRRKWQWIGHTLRKSDDNIAKQALRWNPFQQTGRNVGRPRTTWRRSTEAEMRSVNKSWNELRALAQNRVRWRRGVVDALCSN